MSRQSIIFFISLYFMIVAQSAVARVSPGDMSPSKPLLNNPNRQDMQGYHGIDATVAGINSELLLLNPRQVLEMAKELRLTEKQKGKIVELNRRHMESEQSLGQQIIDREQRLNALLSHKKVDEQILKQIVMEIARLRGELRLLHLKTHLDTKQVLLPKQLEKFNSRKKEKPSGGTLPR